MCTIERQHIGTAETIVAYIDETKRFGRGLQVAAYFGLIPCQDFQCRR
jgi:transposase